MNIIFCFSGTGNSLYAANRIAAEINAEVCNMREPGECGADVIGIVFPVYFWGLPKTVERFLGEVRITNKSAYIFAVVTYGGFAVGADGAVNGLLKKQGVKLSYSAKVKMVENYIPSFKVNDSEKLWKKINAKLDEVIADIKNRSVSRITPYTVLNKLVHKNYPPLKTDCGSLFTVCGCHACGKCVDVCPNFNITLSDGTPKFGGNCELCMGCVNVCPVNAIDYNNRTLGKKRYKNHMQARLYAFNTNGGNNTRFKADFTLPCSELVSRYIPDDYAFNFDGCVNSSVLINDLELGIDSETGIARQISGYHPYVSWKPAALTPPEAREGALVMIDRIDDGIARRIKDDVPTYYDKSARWLCIGSQDCDGADCVRFCGNCVAVVKDGLLSSIWVSLSADSDVWERLE